MIGRKGAGGLGGNTFSDSEMQYNLVPTDMTMLNRSYSVDTDHYMRHLWQKGNNYDVLRSLDTR